MANISTLTVRTPAAALDTDELYIVDTAGTADFSITRTAFLQGKEQTVTATTDGLTTGLIADGTRFVTVTSDTATKVCVLPAGVVGDVINGYVDGVGFEMQTLAGTNTKINNVDCDGTNEAAIPATHFFRATKAESDHWILEGIDEAGLVAQIVPDADV